MSYSSKIQWTESTWNPWHGCKKVSPGCKFCYMYRDKDRYGQDPTTVLRSKTKFDAPLKWNEPKLIFTCSWSDWFIDEADEWRPEAWEIIKNTPHHTYQILTKRPERILECLPDDWGSGYENVWLGVSIEDDSVVDKRIPELLRVPAAVRFLSCEPLIGKLSLRWMRAWPDQQYGAQHPQHHIKGTSHLDGLRELDWVIIGGESGNDEGKYRYRPCEIDWVENIISECKEANVPVFVKQLGTHLAKKLNLKNRHGGNIDEWPEQLRVREFPK